MSRIASPLAGLAAVSLLAVAGGSNLATAQDGVKDALPFDQIRMISPFAPGGGMERSARQFQPAFEKALGLPVVVDPTPGGGTALGSATAVRDGADCSTVLFAPLPHIQFAYLTQEGVGYTGKDLIALGQMYNEPPIIAVFGNAKWDSLEELIEDARERPGEIRFSVSSVNSNFNLGLLELERAADIDLNIVPYEGGSPARTAVRAGEVDGTHVGLYAIAPELEEWKILGVEEEEVSLPGVVGDAPSVTKALEEMGHDDHRPAMEARIGVFVSTQCRENHPDRYEALLEAVNGALNDPLLAETLKDAGDETKAGRTLGQDEFQAIFDDYVDRLHKEIERADDLTLAEQPDE